MACRPQEAPNFKPSFKLSERINKALWTMRNAGLAGVSRRKGTVTTVRDGGAAPDLVDRNFTGEPGAHQHAVVSPALYPQEMIDNWIAGHGIVDDAGQPLRLLLSRLRKTHKALWYAKTQGDLTRFAAKGAAVL
jgi:hypothetical protein